MGRGWGRYLVGCFELLSTVGRVHGWIGEGRGLAKREVGEGPTPWQVEYEYPRGEIYSDDLSSIYFSIFSGSWEVELEGNSRRGYSGQARAKPIQARGLGYDSRQNRFQIDGLGERWYISAR